MKKFIFLFSFATSAAVGAAISQDAVKTIQEFYGNISQKDANTSSDKWESFCSEELKNNIEKYFPKGTEKHYISHFDPRECKTVYYKNDFTYPLNDALSKILDQEELCEGSRYEKPSRKDCNIKHFVYLMYHEGCMSKEECSELLKAFAVDALKEDESEFKDEFKRSVDNPEQNKSLLKNYPYLFTTKYLIFDQADKNEIIRLVKDENLDVLEAVNKFKRMNLVIGLFGLGLITLIPAGACFYIYKKIKQRFQSKVETKKIEERESIKDPSTSPEISFEKAEKGDGRDE